MQLNIGFDQNNDATGKFFYKTAAQWFPSFYKGAPMIRPVVGKSFDHSATPQHQISNVKVYPNPTTGKVHIQMDDDGRNLDYKVLNVYGQCLETGSLHSRELSLDKFADGVYFIQLSADNQILTTEKIIKR